MRPPSTLGGGGGEGGCPPPPHSLKQSPSERSGGPVEKGGGGLRPRHTHIPVWGDDGGGGGGNSFTRTRARVTKHTHTHAQTNKQLHMHSSYKHDLMLGMRRTARLRTALVQPGSRARKQEVATVKAPQKGTHRKAVTAARCPRPLARRCCASRRRGSGEPAWRRSAICRPRGPQPRPAPPLGRCSRTVRSTPPSRL